ncbi:hypothetical protein JAAARDRAFT_124189 [Jaapia argillacea MUCL 33604]|uniref:polynucleotide adenylyltransferase n=1 Tax=Jaapia argillacea MUCL 33604 TaxID=933084 RepID=A0A067Q4Z0_9AGAM|nr:hypothetical protein JAAARDRAFT_124189 [Jaapia argillacea MUCL 33604]
MENGEVGEDGEVEVEGGTSTRSRTKKRGERRERRSRSRDDELETSTIDPELKSSYKDKDKSGDTFEAGGEFIPFDFPDSDDEGKKERKEEREERKVFVREWDRGKHWSADGDSPRKRKADEYERDDGYENKKQRVDAASRKAPWIENVDWKRCNNVAEMLQQEVEAFIEYIAPTHEEDELRGLVIDLVRKAVTQQFPDAEVFPFGSYETKLYLPLGDIDIVIQSESMAYSNKVTVLHALANVMKRSGITDKVSIIAKAKVPIIKFVTTHGRFSVDISINQANGLGAVRMVNQFIAELPALRPLVMIIKAFLSQRSMNEVFTGGLGSFSIVCMAVSFLQMHPKIRRGEIDPEKNLGVLVIEFFELYGCYFNYQEVGISLRDGGTYFSKAQRGWLDYHKTFLLSIEDPGDPSNDISRGSYGITRVRTTLAGAHGILTAAAYMHAGIITSRREGRDVHLRNRNHPEDTSILSSVLGITQEVRLGSLWIWDDC